MREIRAVGETLIVPGDDRSLTYRPRGVTLDDGTWVAHTSRGGAMSSVWCVDLGGRFVEVVHLGHGPVGGELVVVVPDADHVIVGDLVRAAVPTEVPESWPRAVDLVLGLTGPDTIVLTTDGSTDREAVEAFHQALLGVVHG